MIGQQRLSATESFLGEMLLKGTEYHIARSELKNRLVVLRKGADKFDVVAELQGTGGLTDNVSFFAKSGKQGLLVYRTFLYELTFAERNLLIKPLGSVETLPQQVGKGWIGSFYAGTEATPKMFSFDSMGVRQSVRPSTLVSFAVLAGKLVYWVSQPAGKILVLQAKTMPDLSEQRFRFGETKPFKMTNPDKVRIGVSAQGTKLVLVRKKSVAGSAEVWLYRQGQNGLFKQLIVCKGSYWTESKLDEIYVRGHQCLLYLYDGNVCRVLFHINLKTCAVVRLSLNNQPTSPSQSSDTIYGCVKEPGYIEPNSNTGITSRIRMYQLSKSGLRIGYLPDKWENVYVSGRQFFAVERVQSANSPRMQVIEVRPRWVSSAWQINRVSTQMQGQNAADRT